MQLSKIVFLCNSFPFPPQNGAALREAGIIEIAQKIAKTEIVSVLSPGTQRPEGHYNNPTVFIEREHLPFFKKLLFPLRPYVVNGYSKRVEQALRDRYEPGALLWVSRLALGQYISVAKQIGYRVVLDEHNVESDYFFHSVIRGKKWLELPLALQLRYWERRFCETADKVVVTSNRDQKLMNSLSKNIKPQVLPNCISNMPSPSIKTPSQHLLFVGTLNYAPNTEGLYWFFQSVKPLIQTKNISICIVGARPSSELSSFLTEQGAELHANVPDLNSFYAQTTICIAPILSGGGTRLKILEALGRGKAMVSTSKGAEGLDLHTEEHLLISDSPKAFANSIDLLLKSHSLREKIGLQGQARVSEFYTWEAQIPRLQEICRF